MHTIGSLQQTLMATSLELLLMSEPLVSPQDVKAHTSIPLLGYQVRDMPQNDTRYAFQLIQSKQIHTLMAETEELKQQWMKAMAQAAHGEEEEDSFDELE